MSDLNARFWRKVRQDEYGCWIWQGHIGTTGYGQWGLRGTPKSVHRLTWTDLRGDIPDHLQVDHLCAVKTCVNPWHMELVTSQVNNARRLTASTVCHLPPGTTAPWKHVESLKERREHEERERRIAESRAWFDDFFSRFDPDRFESMRRTVAASRRRRTA